MKFQNRKNGSHWSMSLLFLGAILFIGANGQFFNTRCSEPSQCNYNQFLQCLNGYCQCDSRSQVYDHKLNQCVIRARGKCSLNQGNSIKCSKNSVCISSVCECQPGYSESPESLCKPNFQNICQNPQDCEQDRGLACLDGSCQCKNASLSYQGFFGCIDAANPEFIQMMTTLKITEKLLQDNHIDVDAMIDELDLSESSQSDVLSTAPITEIQSRQLFDSYTNTNTDLTTSAQNQASQQQGGGLAGILNILNSLGSLTQLIGGNNNQGGTTAAPAATGGYPSGPANNINLINQFLTLFNKVLPIIRRFKMRFNPFRIIRRLFMNLRNLFKPNAGGYAASKPAYGPPPSSQYGGPPPAAASITSITSAPPQAQSIQDFTQVQPIQQQSTFSNFQNQPNQGQNFQNNNNNNNNQALPSSNFDNPSQFQNQNQNNNFQNQKRQAGVQTQTPNQYSTLPLGSFQNNNNNLNQDQHPNSIPNAQQNFQPNQNQNNFGNNNFNNNNNIIPTNTPAFGNNNNYNNINNNNNQFQTTASSFPNNIIYNNPTNAPGFGNNNNYNNHVPSTTPAHPPLATSPNKYPRQERFSNTYSSDDDSPYLPEHL